ncbi:MAG: hypothetical protein OXI52_08300 [Caldilineaceae bacterium]|nr:hypothetical protein [Caldilineaceae bacterium]MDE0312253.1 hypothetical protein [Caldilineaceae bacterium]
MQISREQFMEQGYLALREVIPPARLEQLQADFETLWSEGGGESGRRSGVRTTRPAAIWKHARSRAWSLTTS